MNQIEPVTAYIEKAPQPHKEILERLRALIAEAVPHAEEQFKWGQPVYATTKGFAYLAFSKNHVNLGFFNFEKLTDPDTKLEGTGKQMRHVKIKKAADINRELFSSWLKQAAVF